MIMPAAFFRTAESQRHPVLAPPVAVPRPRIGFREREREFGVGYGSSSGYASGRHYTGSNPAEPFRIR